MNADAAPQQHAVTAAEIQKRIDDERRRLLLEQNLAVNLEAQRMAPLEAGDDPGLDRVEGLINSCNDRQARIQERIEILEKRLIEASAAERQMHLDGLIVQAEKARGIGEAIIRREYVRHATGVATALARLEALDHFIADVARHIAQAGSATPLATSNQIRHQPARDIERTERRIVNVFDKRHPYYGRAIVPNNRVTGTPERVPVQGGGMCDVEAEVDETITERIGPFFQDPLYQTTELAGIEPNSPFWNGSSRRDVTMEQQRRILAELGIDPTIEL